MYKVLVTFLFKNISVFLIYDSLNKKTQPQQNCSVRWLAMLFIVFVPSGVSSGETGTTAGI
jgi:hypothetical protein